MLLLLKNNALGASAHGSHFFFFFFFFRISLMSVPAVNQPSFPHVKKEKKNKLHLPPWNEETAVGQGRRAGRGTPTTA
jgi:hypothetical protein